MPPDPPDPLPAIHPSRVCHDGRLCETDCPEMGMYCRRDGIANEQREAAGAVRDARAAMARGRGLLEQQRILNQDDIFPLRPRNRTVHRFRQVAAEERRDPLLAAHDAAEAEQRWHATRDAVLGTAEKAELDGLRASYGRLDLPVTVIDWRPVYAGAAALGIALVARWVVRHGR